MAHFYMVGRNFTNNPVTRRGFAKHGIEVEAQSNFGKVVTKLYINSDREDCFRVVLDNHQGSDINPVDLASGKFNDHKRKRN